jgi:hypothetical protein
VQSSISTYGRTDWQSRRFFLAVIRLLTAGGDFDGPAELVNGTIDPVSTEQQLIGIDLPAQGVAQIAIAGQNLSAFFAYAAGTGPTALSTTPSGDVCS